MDHVTAMNLFSHYLEISQSKGIYTIEDSAKIYNAQVVMNEYIINKSKENEPVVSNETTNQDTEELKNENITLNERLKEFEKIKINLMSRNIELDNLRRNYNKKVEEVTKLRSNLNNSEQHEKADNNTEHVEDDDTVRIKILDETPNKETVNI